MPKPEISERGVVLEFFALLGLMVLGVVGMMVATF